MGNVQRGSSGESATTNRAGGHNSGQKDEADTNDANIIDVGVVTESDSTDVGTVVRLYIAMYPALGCTQMRVVRCDCMRMRREFILRLASAVG